MSFIRRLIHISAVLAMALGVLCLTTLPAFAKTVTVESSRVNIRSGPGNYYPVIYTAGQGAKLEVIDELEAWYKVSLPEQKSGYVSIKSLAKRTGGSLSGKKPWIEDKGVGQVASSEIMAATKGIIEMRQFSRDYAKKHNIDPDILESYNTMPFTPEEYQSFKKSLRHRRNIRIPELSREGIPEEDRELGTAIALRLASIGLDKDPSLRKYVSLVGTAVVEETPLYDETLVFIVLDSPQVRSFATPGGYVFVTTGALRLMQDEAELAGVLGHEVVHVVNRHGIEELEKQQARIRSESLISDLDRELEKLDMDRGDTEVIEDLEQLADKMFERIISGRLKESEDESDRLGTMIIYNTGYKADGLKDFILLTEKLESKKKDPSYSHSPASKRAETLDELIRKKRLTRRDRKDFRDRFDEMMR